MFRILLTTTLAALTCLLASTAPAQSPAGDERLFDAMVLDIDSSARTITVELEANDEVETYPVAKDAEFYMYDGILDRPVDFADLHVGQDVALEFDGVEGEPTLSKITSDDS